MAQLVSIQTVQQVARRDLFMLAFISRCVFADPSLPSSTQATHRALAEHAKLDPFGYFHIPHHCPQFGPAAEAAAASGGKSTTFRAGAFCFFILFSHNTTSSSLFVRWGSIYIDIYFLYSEHSELIFCTSTTKGEYTAGHERDKKLLDSD